MNQQRRDGGSREHMADYAVGLERGGHGRGSGGRRLGGRHIVGVHENGRSDVMVRIKLQIVVAVLASAILLGVARLLPEPPVVESPLWWSHVVRPGVPASAVDDSSRSSR